MSATPDSTLVNPEHLADLQRQLAECRAERDEAHRQLAETATERDEALARETATAEVLQVINSSPGHLTPVFDVILKKAHTLCGAALGSFVLNDCERLRAVATRGYPKVHDEVAREGQPVDIPFHARLARGEIVHVPDLDSLEAPTAMTRSAVEVAGSRTYLAVPLRKGDALLGYLSAHRREVRPFPDNQIALLQNFATQAVIAMEHARLLTETREALEQQTATAEVLGIISSSPGRLEPVFEAMLANAVRICGGAFGILALGDGDGFRGVAVHGVGARFREALSRLHYPPPNTGLYLMQQSGRTVQVLDCAAEAAYDPVRAVNPDFATVRTALHVPMLKEGSLLGAILIFRDQVMPFGIKQIELVENFSKQAVIAIENTRLLAETREALEQQTATAEVLQVINSSPGDLAPVFDAILEKAHTLCGAVRGALALYDGESFRAVAIHGYPEDVAEAIRRPYGANVFFQRIVDGDRYVQIPDFQAVSAQLGDPVGRAALDHLDLRTWLAVPLRKEGLLLGYISAVRSEVRPFSDKEIALLENFAAQAVIAMENARLITETREALEQQTATAEILEVINRSPGDLAPVFDAILEKAHTVCGASLGALVLRDGEQLRAVATRGYPEEYAALARKGGPLHSVTAFGRLQRGERVVHVADAAALKSPAPITRAAIEIGGVRTSLSVPLRRDNALLGYISAQRQEVRPYFDREIALLESFAAQAVIAMDNARLLQEIRQRQAELRVTFDNMGDGVAMFDSELRLAAWNLNFQRILELPDPLLAERPRVGEFVRYLATHGEYGAVDVEAEVRRLTELVGTQWSAERTRPDGRVIEVRSNPVPGGGVVLIYSDITERKRAEAEIHAARDTAEKALQELQTAQASLLHAQKMAALGQLTAGIAHEIKNPLNFVNNFAELSGELLLELQETTAPAVAALGEDERAAVDEVVEMLRGNLDKIAEHGKRADGIVKSMLEHSRGVSGERRAVDLNALIEEALNLAYHGARAQDQNFNITLECELAHSIAPIELVPQDMTRVFLNLFGNGFYAAAQRGREAGEADFRPVLKVTTRDLGEAVEIRVRDNGTGIAPEIRDKLFQPFVTTKPTGEGTGLGLSISYEIVTQQHGGTIEVDSRLGEFTEFTIRLPACVR